MTTSRTKRAESVTKGFTGFRNRIISTPTCNDSTSLEKQPQAIDRKQMIPR